MMRSMVTHWMMAEMMGPLTESAFLKVAQWLSLVGADACNESMVVLHGEHGLYEF